MNPIRNIMVPTDFSLRSKAALSHAMDLAHRYQASVEVLHVVEVPVILGGVHSAIAPSVIEEVRKEGAASAEVEISNLLQELPHTDTVVVQTTVLTGNPRNVICERIASEKPDLVVVAVEGRTGVSRFLIGSVAERVVRSAACPVLTWRPPQKRLAA